MGKQFFFPSDSYISRRETLIEKFNSKQILLLGNEEAGINFADNWYRFRQDSTFLYYIGINLPSLAAIIDPAKGETILFGDDASIDMVVWTGPQTPLQELAEKVGVQKVLPYAELANYVNQDTAYLPPYRPEHQLKLQSLIGVELRQPSAELILAIESQRSVKSYEEIEELDKAVTLTAQMHEHIIKSAKPGMYEYQLVSLASKFALDHNANWSFPPIMTTHGETLHNHNYSNQLKENDLMLYDGGIEVASGYCGDMTRSFPVNSTFSSIQKDIYNIVLSAYKRAKLLAQPEVLYRDIHLKSCLAIVEGLIELGWMKGNAEDAVNAGAHTLFFQHGLGHLMGLDVHDMENFGEELIGYNNEVSKSKEFGLKSLRLGKKLQTGYVITIEPGIYIIPMLIEKFETKGRHTDFINYDEVKKHVDFGGIRIEDDFVIIESGNRQLGNPLTVEADGIEELRGG